MTAPSRIAAGTVRLASRYAARSMARYATRALKPAGPPKAALVALAASAATLITTAALGPSAAVEPLPGTPPLGAAAHPSSVLVTALLVITVIAGAYGVLGCLDALKRGWALRVRWLLAASMLVAVALGLMAPVGSSDPGSYAAYGRLAATGHDPYAIAPDALTGPYQGLAEEPWRATPSVYGPIATGEQWLAATIAGNGQHAPAYAVFLLGIVNALAFVATGLLLQRLARGQAGRRRAAVLFSANPLLLFEGVAGAHLDVVVTLFVVAALYACRRTTNYVSRRTTNDAFRQTPQNIFRRAMNRVPLGTFAAGALVGIAAGFKASAGLVGLGLAWVAAAMNPRRHLVALAAGAAAVLVPSYLLAGPHVFDQLRQASNFVSFADPWRLVTHLLESVLGHDSARTFIKTGAWIAFVVLALLLNRGLPGPRPETARAGFVDTSVACARATLVLVLAWLLTAPYVLPWYAIVAFALLVLLPASGFDRLLVFWTAILAVAYLPGRASVPGGSVGGLVKLPGWLHGALDVWKSGFAPVLLFGIAVIAALLCVRPRASAVTGT